VDDAHAAGAADAGRAVVGLAQDAIDEEHRRAVRNQVVEMRSPRRPARRHRVRRAVVRRRRAEDQRAVGDELARASRLESNAAVRTRNRREVEPVARAHEPPEPGERDRGHFVGASARSGCGGDEDELRDPREDRPAGKVSFEERAGGGDGNRRAHAGDATIDATTNDG
jgi:hypothetical protein